MSSSHTQPHISSNLDRQQYLTSSKQTSIFVNKRSKPIKRIYAIMHLGQQLPHFGGTKGTNES